MDKTFEQWMNEVDGELEMRCGLSSSDLPDKLYRNMYEGQMTPEEVALEVLNDEEYYEDPSII